MKEGTLKHSFKKERKKLSNKTKSRIIEEVLRANPTLNKPIQKIIEEKTTNPTLVRFYSNWISKSLNPAQSTEAYLQGLVQLEQNVLVKEILFSNPLLASSTSDGNPLIFQALYNMDILKLLVEEYKLPLDVRNSKEESLLYCACRKFEPALVAYLLSKGAKTTFSPTKEENSILDLLINNLAASFNYRGAGVFVEANEVIQLLVHFGAKIINMDLKQYIQDKFQLAPELAADILSALNGCKNINVLRLLEENSPQNQIKNDTMMDALCSQLESFTTQKSLVIEDDFSEKFLNLSFNPNIDLSSSNRIANSASSSKEKILKIHMKK